MDNLDVGKNDLNKYCAVLAAEFPFADELNSMARQSAAERTWSAISRFYDNCKKRIKGQKGYPKFKRTCRSVEYKTSGWKLSLNRKAITFRDVKNIGTLKLKGTYDLNYYDIKQIKRVRLVRRADGYYAQFAIDVKVRVETEPTGQAVGIDLGLKFFIADNKGNTEGCPQFYRKSERHCSNCGKKVKKSLSTRTHVCPHCGFTEDRDTNAAINILKLALSTVGHTGTYAWGDLPSWAVGAILSSNGELMNQESPHF